MLPSFEQPKTMPGPCKCLSGLPVRSPYRAVGRMLPGPGPQAPLLPLPQLLSCPLPSLLSPPLSPPGSSTVLVP